MSTVNLKLYTGEVERVKVGNMIPEYSFSKRTDILSASIPEGVTTIGLGAFSGCHSLVSIAFPEGMTTIGMHAFDCCVSLTSVSIPEGVTTIGHWAFRCCDSLTSVKIPEGVTTIGHWAFSPCAFLTEITLHDGVVTIGDNAFDPLTTVLVRMSWSLENFKRCDKASRARVRTILLCLCRLEIPIVVQRTILGFLDLTRVLEI